MPPVEQRVISILKSAELSFELGIINASRYGPSIHANVPDYAEILLRVFIEENNLTSRKFFHTLAGEVDNYFLTHRMADRAIYRGIVDYFINTRESFRNPLHHTDRVQGYIIEPREALLCLIKFDDLLKVLFPTVAPNNFEDLTYPCYVQYIRMLYDEALGRGNHRLFLSVNAALRRLEEQDAYNCPHEHDASRLMAVRRLFRLPNDAFTITVLKYRPQMKDRLITILDQTGRRMTPRQLKNALAGDPDLGNAREDEIEACLQFIEGEAMPGRGVVLIANMQYYLAPL
jgi:hypothetical protein